MGDLFGRGEGCGFAMSPLKVVLKRGHKSCFWVL